MRLVYTVELTWRMRLLFITTIRLADGFQRSGTAAKCVIHGLVVNVVSLVDSSLGLFGPVCELC